MRKLFLLLFIGSANAFAGAQPPLNLSCQLQSDRPSGTSRFYGLILQSGTITLQASAGLFHADIVYDLRGVPSKKLSIDGRVRVLEDQVGFPGGRFADIELLAQSSILRNMDGSDPQTDHFPETLGILHVQDYNMDGNLRSSLGDGSGFSFLMYNRIPQDSSLKVVCKY